MENGTKLLAISKPNNNNSVETESITRATAVAYVRNIPEGDTIYTFEYPVKSVTGMPFKFAVITSDEQNIIVCAIDKNNRDCVMVHNAKTGAFVNKILLRHCGIKVSNV